MRGLAAIFLSFLSLFPASAATQTPAASDADWFTASSSILCVTEGRITSASGNQLAVDVPKVRAYVNRWTAHGIEARFSYLGPTSVQSPLGSGTVRQQFGLKLRAQDACNLIYVMWRFEPENKLVVSLKSNPGQNSSSKCGNRGYHDMTPAKASPLPAIHEGDAHTLRAELDAADLTVFADDRLVWQGNVGAEALYLNGPVGIRSDNARLQIDLRVKHSEGAHPDYVVACKSGPAD